MNSVLQCLFAAFMLPYFEFRASLFPYWYVLLLRLADVSSLRAAAPPPRLYSTFNFLAIGVDELHSLAVKQTPRWFPLEDSLKRVGRVLI